MCLTEELKERYRKFLEDLAQKHSGELFSNGGKDHAIVLYQVLLNHASGEVRIFCEEGISEIWQDKGVKKSLVDFISKDNSRVRILVENENDEGFAELKDNDKVTVCHISSEGLNKIYTYFDNDNCNFAVFDSNMFRFEYDKQDYKAYGSFNDEEISNSMKELFDEVWEQEGQR